MLPHYDEIFDLHGAKIYMVVPPVEKQELFRKAVELYDGAIEISIEGLKAFRASMIPNFEALQTAGDAAEHIYDVLIGNLVVAWEITRPDGTEVSCTPENKQKLRMSMKAEMSEKLVGILRLWLMAL